MATAKIPGSTYEEAPILVCCLIDEDIWFPYSMDCVIFMAKKLAVILLYR